MKQAYKPIFIAFVIMAIGVGLSSVYLFSFFDGKRYTQEHIDLSVESALSEREGSLSPVFLTTLFVPNLFGNITGENIRSLNPSHAVLFWEANLSGGIAVSLLLLLGVIWSFQVSPINTDERRRRRWYVLVILVLYVFAILCVLGRHTPFYRYVIGFWPGIGQLPRPIRYRMIQCFATAVLAGVGLDSLLNLQISKFKYFRSWVYSYLGIVFLIIAMVITYPWISQRKYSGWVIKPSALVSGYFSAGQSVCMYSSSFPSKKMGAMFEGESTGEIRYADNINTLPTEGVFLTNYHVDKKGWHEFNVDIPPQKYVWFYQKSGSAKIGYIKIGERTHSFYYDNDKEKWISSPHFKSIWFYQEDQKKTLSLIGKLLSDKGILRKSIIVSISYWVLVSIVIILSVYYLPLKKFGYLLGVVAFFEFFIFGILAFYGGNYTCDRPLLNQVRALKPLSHPILQRMSATLAVTVKNSTLRIATSQPFYDNFFRLSGYSAFMGYEMHPLETRFKRAIERAYNQPINYSIYYNEPLVETNYIHFLNNFSVGYFIYFSQIDMLKKAIELNPTNAGIYSELGNLYRKQSKHKEAQDVFKKAIELDSTSDEAYINFGRCYREQYKYQQSEAMFKKAIELNPANIEIYIELGNLFLHQFRYKEAEDVLKKSLELNFASDRAYINLGRCYQEQSKYEEAGYMFKKAIELNPTNAGIYSELGNLYRKQSKHKEAQDVFKKAIELSLDDKKKQSNFNSREAQSIFINDSVVPLVGESSSFVHVNSFALPRVFTLDRVVLASEKDQLKQLVSGDLRKAVYLSHEELLFKKNSIKKDASLNFSDLQKVNRILRFDLDNPNRIDVDIEVSIPSMLVLTEIWYPGWEARIDGKLTKIYRVNYCQRAVWLEQGRHNVQFCFKPLAWRLGLVISWGTMLFILGIWLTAVIIKKSIKNF